MNYHNFKNGDRVIFTRNPRGYSIGKANPLRGTSYFCEGEVHDTDLDSEFVYVRWDNGETNDYIPECLELVRPKITLPEGLFQL